MSGETLRVEGVTKAFGAYQVVTDVTFERPLAGLTGLIGPNGAGKSTLFAVLSGFESADRGTIRFRGESLDGVRPERRAARGLGRTFQVPRPFPHLTVRDNLAVAAPGQAGEGLFDALLRPGRVRAQERRVLARAEEIVAFLRLGPVAGARAGTLSGGQRKLLELGRAMMAEPRYILLDEPFAGVNPVLIEEISARIREANARGIGFLVVEHDLSALARLADHLLVMDRGRLLAQGPPGAMLADPAVQEAYMGGVA